MTILKNMLIDRTIFCLGLLLAMLLSTTLVHAAAVGKVVFAMGSPQASDTAGVSRLLKKSDEIFSGDTLSTNKGRLQISFIDGAFISLQPNTEYEIEQYKYSGKPDGTELSIYRLIKGGIRAITGLIGKSNPEAYKVHTAVATIGIRGTGHNTRICQGDCPGKADGLYHNTWEGITYVTNDVDTVDVPAGKGVYVRDIEAPILFLDQPSIVTALDTATEELAEVEEEQEIFEAGDQFNEQGNQRIVTGTGEVFVVAAGSTVIPLGVNPSGGFFDDGLAFVAVEPDLANISDPVEITLGINTSAFFNASGQLIGAVFTDTEFNNERAFGTIDLDAVLGSNDPAAVAEISAMVAAADPAIIADFQLNPASVAEFTVTGGLSTGRWANGRVLSLDAPIVSNNAEIIELTGFQSIHFVFGTEPSALPTLGTATYNLINGTDSTSVSGATIGNGATSGVIIINFGLSSGAINMVVNHAGIDYLVSGSLNILSSENAIFDQFFNVIASTSAAGSACNPNCLTEIDGSFFGPGIGSNNSPQYIGIEFDISETDEITGVAGFESAGLVVPPPLTPQQQLLTSNLSGVSIPGGLLFINQIADASLTGDPVTSITSLLQADFTGGASPDTLTLVTATNFDTFNDGTLYITRWSNGSITDTFNNGTPNTFNQNADQGVHLVLGSPTTSLPAISPGGTATYNFINGSATQTTHLAGADIADGGITGGTILLNFTLAQAFPNFTLSHDGEIFTLTGSAGLNFQTLAGSSATQLGFFGTGQATSSIICSSPCNTDIGATFAGDFSSILGNVPAEIGVVFRVATGDPFTGAGGFTFSSAAASPPPLTPQQQLLASTLVGNAVVSNDALGSPFIGKYADADFTGDPTTSLTSILDNGFEVTGNILALGAGSQNFDTFNDGTLFITRWSGGAASETNSGSAFPANNGTFPFNFTNNQSIHLAFGTPTTSVPSTGLGNYTFISGSETSSTSFSGGTIGNGIQSGSIILDFSPSPTATVNFIIQHPNTLGSPFNYTLSGLLFFDSPLVGSSTTRLGFSGSISASGGASNCSSSCPGSIASTFIGDSSSVIGNVPTALGVTYYIQEGTINNGPGPITGAGGFGLNSVTP